MDEAQAVSVLDAHRLQAIDDHYWANATPTVFLAAFTVWCSVVAISATLKARLICRISPIIFVTTLIAAHGLATNFEIYGSDLLGLRAPYPYSCNDVILVVGRHAPPCEVERFTSWAARAFTTRNLSNIFSLEKNWVCAALCIGAAYAMAISMSLSSDVAWWIAGPEAAEHDPEVGAARGQCKIVAHEGGQCCRNCLSDVHCSQSCLEKEGD